MNLPHSAHSCDRCLDVLLHAVAYEKQDQFDDSDYDTWTYTIPFFIAQIYAVDGCEFFQALLDEVNVPSDNNGVHMGTDAMFKMEVVSLNEEYYGVYVLVSTEVSPTDALHSASNEQRARSIELRLRL